MFIHLAQLYNLQVVKVSVFDTNNPITVVHFDRWITELSWSCIKNKSHDYLYVKGVGGSDGPTDKCLVCELVTMLYQRQRFFVIF